MKKECKIRLMPQQFTRLVFSSIYTSRFREGGRSGDTYKRNSLASDCRLYLIPNTSYVKAPIERLHLGVVGDNPHRSVEVGEDGEEMDNVRSADRAEGQRPHEAPQRRQIGRSFLQ